MSKSFILTAHTKLNREFFLVIVLAVVQGHQWCKFRSHSILFIAVFVQHLLQLLKGFHCLSIKFSNLLNWLSDFYLILS